MTADIAIGLLSASLLLPPDAHGEAARLDGVLRRVADHGLGRAVRDIQVSPGQWCIRRLDVRVRPDLSQPDSSIERLWAGALAGAVQRAVDGAGGPGPGRDDAREVVHYPTPRHAAVDLVTSAASGRRDRAWAWRQIGLTASGIGAVEVSPARELMLGCLARVEDPLGVVVTAVDRVGIAKLDHALGADGWLALGRLVVASRGMTLPGQPAGPSPAAAVSWPPATPPPVRPGATAPPLTGPSGHRTDQPAPRPQAGQTVPAARPAPPAASAVDFARGLAASSQLAGRMSRARLQPPPSTRRVWALLVAIEADPALPRRADAAAILAALADVLTERTPSAATSSREIVLEALGTADPSVPTLTDEPLAASATEPIPGPGAHPVDQTVASSLAEDVRDPGLHGQERCPTDWIALEAPGTAEPSGPTSATEPIPGPGAHPVGKTAAGSLAEDANDPGLHGRERYPTDWAGLPFLLNTAGHAGLLESIAADPVLDGRPVRWILHALAGALVPIGPGDPAALALAGLTPRDAGPTAVSPPDDSEGASIDALAARWATATANRLAIASWAGLAPSAAVERVARRPGHLIADPGWIEIHLDLEVVDIDLRRAGLDFDPGWLPWLGAVVRIVYG